VSGEPPITHFVPFQAIDLAYCRYGIDRRYQFTASELQYKEAVAPLSYPTATQITPFHSTQLATKVLAVVLAVHVDPPFVLVDILGGEGDPIPTATQVPPPYAMFVIDTGMFAGTVRVHVIESVDEKMPEKAVFPPTIQRVPSHATPLHEYPFVNEINVQFTALDEVYTPVLVAATHVSPFHAI
jgi:hypothetical protein